MGVGFFAVRAIHAATTDATARLIHAHGRPAISSCQVFPLMEITFPRTNSSSIQLQPVRLSPLSQYCLPAFEDLIFINLWMTIRFPHQNAMMSPLRSRPGSVSLTLIMSFISIRGSMLVPSVSRSISLPAVLQSLSTEKGLDEIEKALRIRFRIDADRDIRKDIEDCLAALKKKGLIK